jgi:hypothetical protein
MSEERWHEAAYVRRLEARVAKLEAMEIRPHELNAMRDVVTYLRSLAQTFPDMQSDKFAAKMTSYAQMFEDVADRIEAAR